MENLDPKRRIEDQIDHTDVTQSHIYRQFKGAAEYRCPWLNTITNHITFCAEESVLQGDWVKYKFKTSKSFGEVFKNSITFLFFFAIFAIVKYFFPDDNYTRLEAALNAFFFWTLPYILVSFRGFDKYIKALMIVIITMIFPILPLFLSDIISFRGIPYLRYVIVLAEFFNRYIGAKIPVISSINTNNKQAVLQLTAGLLGGMFVIEFILMLLYALFRSTPRIDTILTNQALYVREKTKDSIFSILIYLIYIPLNPFMVKQYKDLADRVRYNKIAKHEGKKYDFSRITFDSVEKIEKSRDSSYGRAFFGLLLGIIGFLSTFIPLVLIGGLIFIINIVPKKTFTIVLKLSRKKIEGSWILSHDDNMIVLRNVPLDFAKYFNPKDK
jgi:hypothetical protein